MAIDYTHPEYRRAKKRIILEIQGKLPEMFIRTFNHRWNEALDKDSVAFTQIHRLIDEFKEFC